MGHKTVGPGVLNVQIETTPSPSDPADADQFYRALGMSVMACSRLEGQFNLCLLLLMNMPGANVGYILPIAWGKRAELCRKALKNASWLATPLGAEFKPLITEIVDFMQHRHTVIHPLWERFVSSDPLTVATIHLKPIKGTTDKIQVMRGRIPITMLDEIRTTANQLNAKLLPIVQLLCSLRRPPKEARTL